MQLSSNFVQSYYNSLLNELRSKSYIYSKLSKRERFFLRLQVHHLLPKHDGGGENENNLVFISVEDHL